MAIAVHAMSGDFMASYAIGPAFVRTTYADGSRFGITRNLPVHPGWYHLKNQTRFEFGKLKGASANVYGGRAMLATDRRGSARLQFLTADGHFVAVDHAGKTMKVPAYVPGGPVSASGMLARHIDHSGSWTGDDDFAGKSGDFHPALGLVRGAGGSRAAQGRRTTLGYYADTGSILGPGGDGGTTYVINGDGFSTGDASGGGTWHSYSACSDAGPSQICGIEYTFVPDPTAPGVSPLPGNLGGGDSGGDSGSGGAPPYVPPPDLFKCVVDGERVVAYAFALGGAFALAAAGCTTVETGIGLVACVGGIAMIPGAGVALADAVSQFNSDGCKLV